MPSSHFERYDRLNSIPSLIRDNIATIVNSDEYIIHYNWLELVESSCLKLGYQPCYIVGFWGQLVMGMAVNFILPGFRVKNGRAKHDILKLSMGMLPLSYETNIFLDSQEYQEVFLKGYLSIIQKKWLPTVYFFLPFTMYENLFENILGKKYLKRPYYPSAYLETNFNSFDQYLHSLKCKRRRSVRKNVEIFKSHNVSFEYCENPGQYQDRLYELANNVSQKNATHGSPFLLDRSIFKLLESKMKQHFHLILAKKENEIIGFSLILEKNNVFDYRAVGLDYFYSKDAAVYFNLFYEVIRLAINRKINRIEMGITQIHIKKRLGCSLRQEHAFITTSYNWMTQLADFIGTIPENRFQDSSLK